MVDGSEAETFKANQNPVAPNDVAAETISDSNQAFFLAKSAQTSAMPAEFAAADKFQITSEKSETAPAKGVDQLALNDKQIKPLDNPLYTKLSAEEQAKAAKDVAGEIAEKGLTDRTVRDHLRTKMLQVYLGGDTESQGNEKKLNEFVKQVNDNLPKGSYLKLEQPKDDQDYKAFLKGAGDAIDKLPGMTMGAHGQIQLWKTENGQEKMVGKTHYAASVKKPTPANG